jgi:hypothetical protein
VGQVVGQLLRGLTEGLPNLEVLVAGFDSIKERQDRGFGLVELPAGGVRDSTAL